MNGKTRGIKRVALGGLECRGEHEPHGVERDDRQDDQGQLSGDIAHVEHQRASLAARIRTHRYKAMKTLAMTSRTTAAAEAMPMEPLAKPFW